jgi:hypothetical protein
MTRARFLIRRLGGGLITSTGLLAVVVHSPNEERLWRNSLILLVDLADGGEADITVLDDQVSRASLALKVDPVSKLNGVQVDITLLEGNLGELVVLGDLF